MEERKDRLESQLLDYIRDAQREYGDLVGKESEIARRKLDLQETLESLKICIKFHLARTGRNNEGLSSQIKKTETKGHLPPLMANDMKEERLEKQAGYGSVLPEPPTKNKYSYMSVPAALIEFFLEHENKEALIPEIFEYLTKASLVIGGKDPLANLTAVLYSDNRFERVKRGIYRLKPELFQDLKISGHRLEWKLEEVRK